MSNHTKRPYQPLTVKMAVDLAAPHTWPAAVMPAFLAVCFVSTRGHISIVLALFCLAIAVLMQASVNTFNDYYDYVKGTDSEADNVAVDDAVLVYNNVDPRAALRLAIGFLGSAFVLGIPCIVAAGPAPLVIALIGAVFVVAYSAGSSPVSYLPIGEFVSGVVMGGLIPLATYTVLTGELDFMVLVWALPTIIGVGLIMMTNNTSDIERDIHAGRKTLPVLLGRTRAKNVYHVLLIIMLLAVVVNTVAFFSAGCLILPFFLLAAFPLVKALWLNPLIPERRLQSMPQILSVNVVVGAFYAAAVLASSLQLVVWA